MVVKKNVFDDDSGWRAERQVHRIAPRHVACYAPLSDMAKPRTDIADAVIDAALDRPVPDRDAIFAMSRRIASKARGRMPAVPALRAAYARAIGADPGRANPVIDRMLRRADIRSLSGVAVVTVLTEPYPCPGKCVYCPTEAIMPKSYLSNEPAAMRALLNTFDPAKQVTARLNAMAANGHPVDKVELIVKGGTWSSYPWTYRKRFITRCFDACNAFGSARTAYASSLSAAQKKNEHAAARIVGITLETRPDHVTPKEVVRLRELGCTRVELGVQSIDDRILELTKRGHGVDAVKRAAGLLRDAGYKTDFHMMPQLPGSTPESDLAELRSIFEDPAFRPDMLKIYPTAVVELAELYEWWKDGTYAPYPDEDLVRVLIAAKREVPRYCRISRLVRDIPSTSIVAGNRITNLRQTVQARMAEEGASCACLRCREIGRVRQTDPNVASAAPVMFDDVFDASEGEEHFISMEDRDRRAVFAFCRLRLPPKEPRNDDARALHDAMPELRGSAFIRELHTYGHLVPIDDTHIDATQHKGHGKRLMAEAERIAKTAGYRHLAVIAGAGVRAYYRKLGYRLRGTYMVKRLS